MNDDKMNAARTAIESTASDVKDNLKKAGDTIGEKIDSVSANTQSALGSACDTMQTLQNTISSKTQDMAKCTDDFVQQQPWRAVAVSILMGVGLGLYMSRDKNRGRDY